MADEKTAKKPKMMVGTNGYNDYLCIARVGGVALGIKPNDISPGAKFGHPGTVWFGARLRAAPAGDLFADEDKGEGNVVKMPVKDPASLGSVWPEVVWEKEDAQRASTTIGTLVRGSLDGSIEDAKVILDRMKSGKLSTQMAEYVASLAGLPNLVLTVDDIADWLTENIYGKIATKLEKAIEARGIVEKEMEHSIGTFGMQAQMLKKAYSKLTEQAAPDIDDADGSLS